jgi:DNA-binding transcriptional ArsR family regulator
MELEGAVQLTQPGSGLDGYMLTVLMIMVSTGMLGGVANFFMSEKAGGMSWQKEVFKYIVLGVIAALTVPLFLNMISSNLLAMARANPIDLFVFAGFCLIYVLFSRRFFENIANKLLLQLSQVGDAVNRIKVAQESAGESWDSRGVEPSLAAPQPEPAVAREEAAKVGYNDVEIMRAISEGKFAYGNISGIAGELGFSRDLVNARLGVLKNLGLIELKIDDKNVLHWFLAPKGRHLLGEVLEGAAEEGMGAAKRA